MPVNPSSSPSRGRGPICSCPASRACPRRRECGTEPRASCRGCAACRLRLAGFACTVLMNRQIHRDDPRRGYRVDLDTRIHLGHCQPARRVRLARFGELATRSIVQIASRPVSGTLVGRSKTGVGADTLPSRRTRQTPLSFRTRPPAPMRPRWTLPSRRLSSSPGTLTCAAVSRRGVASNTEQLQLRVTEYNTDPPQSPGSGTPIPSTSSTRAATSESS